MFNHPGGVKQVSLQLLAFSIFLISTDGLGVVSADDHADLTHVRNATGQLIPIKTTADWERRRQQILDNFQLVTGPLPGKTYRVPLDVKVLEETPVGKLVRRKVTYQSDPTDRVPAYIFLPATKPAHKLPAVLCLHQTTAGGKDEPAGLKGSADLKYALELAERGYVCIVPDYPSFGEHAYDFAEKHGYHSGTMKAIWDNMRAVDLLETLPEVDPTRLGCIGHSLGGHNAIFTAVFEPRLKAIVSSCGFTSLRKDDLPSWTGRVYMPRLKTVYNNDTTNVPFEFHELIAALAPRSFLAVAAEKDSDFDVTGVRDVMQAASKIYTLHGVKNHLAAHYPATGHAFPQPARQVAYEFLDRHLGVTTK